MLKKQTIILITDSSGFIWFLIFHLYHGYKKKTAKTAARVRGVGKFFFKGFNFLKKYHRRCLIIYTKKEESSKCGLIKNFYNNSGLIIRKKTRKKYPYYPKGVISLKLYKFKFFYKHFYFF